MKNKYFVWVVFYLVAVTVSVGLEAAAQAWGILPKRELSANVVGAAVAYVPATILFAWWVRRRQKSSSSGGKASS